MHDHGENIYDASMCSGLVHYQFGESDQPVSNERANEDTPIKKCTCVVTRALEIHSIVRERLSLANRTLIVDLDDSAKEGVIEGDLPNHNTFILGLAGSIPRDRLDLSLPPMLKRRNWQNG
jgi:hypothetical protein